MKFYSAFVVLLGLTLHALSAPGLENLSLSKRLSIPDGVSAVVSMQDQSSIGIVGPINSNVLDTYRTMQLKSVATTLYIDSGGGDVTSAIALADDLRKHGTRLVVVGKCFSACANYIFTGTVRKDVLPGSLIGIHSSTLTYYTDAGSISMPQRNQLQMEKLDTNGNIRRQLLIETNLEKRFYSGIGLSKRNFEVFEEYQLRLENSIGKNYSGCQNIDMWILSKKELQDMGIKGMNAIWTPSTIREVMSISKNLGLNPANVFFGSEQKLSSACKKL